MHEFASFELLAFQGSSAPWFGFQEGFGASDDVNAFLTFHGNVHWPFLVDHFFFQQVTNSSSLFTARTYHFLLYFHCLTRSHFCVSTAARISREYYTTLTYSHRASTSAESVWRCQDHESICSYPSRTVLLIYRLTWNGFSTKFESLFSYSNKAYGLI